MSRKAALPFFGHAETRRKISGICLLKTRFFSLPVSFQAASARFGLFHPTLVVLNRQHRMRLISRPLSLNYFYSKTAE